MKPALDKDFSSDIERTVRIFTNNEPLRVGDRAFSGSAELRRSRVLRGVRPADGGGRARGGARGQQVDPAVADDGAEVLRRRAGDRQHAHRERDARVHGDRRVPRSAAQHPPVDRRDRAVRHRALQGLPVDRPVVDVGQHPGLRAAANAGRARPDRGRDAGVHRSQRRARRPRVHRGAQQLHAVRADAGPRHPPPRRQAGLRQPGQLQRGARVRRDRAADPDHRVHQLRQPRDRARDDAGARGRHAQGRRRDARPARPPAPGRGRADRADRAGRRARAGRADAAVARRVRRQAARARPARRSDAAADDGRADRRRRRARRAVPGAVPVAVPAGVGAQGQPVVGRGLVAAAQRGWSCSSSRSRSR